MAGGARTNSTVQHICVEYLADDPRIAPILAAARDLGIHTLTNLHLADLVFIEGNVDNSTRALLESLLVDPLLQRGTWNDTPQNLRRYVETAMHPGVADSTTDQLVRLGERMGLGFFGVATGKRFVFEGPLSDDELDRLVASELANAIIERWSIDTPIAPSFVNPDARATATVELVTLDATTELEHLRTINVERGLALDDAELLAVRDYFAGLGRLPTDVELETIAQTWSEHCSHKTFRASITLDDGSVIEPLLAQLRRSTSSLNRDFVVSAFDGNAGIISFEPGRTLALKCETHNHPSAIEPFGGANTGVGGVIRDIMGSAHHPIACTNVLCFGPPNTPHRALPVGVLPPRRIRSGVVAGIADYGNKIGLPTVAGAVLYDAGYTANPLVFAGCIGTATHYEAPVAPQPGDRICVLGGGTGRDGLRGATFSSMTMDASTGDVSGASVQIGDPITEKLLIDVLANTRPYYRSITDCGAGGLSSAVGEMAQGVGANVDLSCVHLKYPGLAPWEIWLSEAQERMVLGVPPEHVDALRRVCERHGVVCSDIGMFTGDDRLTVRFGDTTVLDCELDFLHDGRPQRAMRAVLPRPNAQHQDAAPPWITAPPMRDIVLALLAHPNIASKADIIHRFDTEIRGATASRPLVGVALDGHGDGVVIAEPCARNGFAIGIGINPYYGLLDPRRMALAVIDEAIRNVVCVGANPDRVALLDNFSWGDPRRETTLGALVAAVGGCIEGAEAFRAPFVSGKDSLNNEYLGSDGLRHAVPPTLVITAIADVADADATVTADFKRAGNIVILLGRSLPEFGASHAAMALGAQPDGPVPTFDTNAPARYQTLHTTIAEGLISACHDCAEGGVAVAVAEMAIGGRLGMSFAPIPDASVVLFGESLGRIVIEVAPEHADEITRRFAESLVLGTVIADETLHLPDGTQCPLHAVIAAWTSAP